jgi:L-2-hydroxyglutarate oxidase LhgO
MGTDPIIIIGAGVLGLTTASTLLSRCPETTILIIASELPTDPPTSWSADYASM